MVSTWIIITVEPPTQLKPSYGNITSSDPTHVDVSMEIASSLEHGNQENNERGVHILGVTLGRVSPSLYGDLDFRVH